MTTPSGHHPATDLAALLDVETIDRDLFRGPVKPGATGRVFGGQVVAQAFMAAQRSIDDDKVAHSFHAYFLRPGSEAQPIMFRVERDFDGGSFANRRVIAMQKGEALLSLTASFQRPETGLSHAAARPDVPAPETLPSIEAFADRADAPLSDGARAFLLQPSAFEMRPVGGLSYVQREPGAPSGALWFRLRSPAPADPALRRAILAYVSDFSLFTTALMQHGRTMFDDPLQTASLDHALWFHNDVPLDDWLLYATDSAWSGAGRGHARGAIHARDGRLIAQTVQEGLMRLRPDKAAGVTIPHLP
jgi:acyl-CoA thioesterase-2